MRGTLTFGLIAVACVVPCASAWGQADCGVAGPDLVISHIEGVQNYAAASGLDAVVFATRQTNVGSVALSADLVTAAHPVQAPNLYRHRIVGGVSRFEQIGMGWCFHAGIPLNMGGFCTCSGGSSSTIGPGCSDPHSAGSMGTAQNLGPRWQVNPSSGVLVHPHAIPSGGSSGRIRFAAADVDPVANAGATYFAELIVLHNQETAASAVNNASWRPLNLSFAAGNATFALSGVVTPAAAAIEAWETLVPDVTRATLDVPNDGRFVVAARTVRVGGNAWNYEYAVFNLNSARGASAFVLPRPPGVVVESDGFHDVDYHSGDGPGGVSIVGTDWMFSAGVSEVRWDTEPFAVNPAANALRWGTMYNFRVTCNAAPVAGEPTLELFVPGEPGTLNAALPVPGGPSCLGDHDGSGVRDVTDIFAFLSDWFAQNAAGDADGDGASTVPDIFNFLGSWFSGC